MRTAVPSLLKISGFRFILASLGFLFLLMSLWFLALSFDRNLLDYNEQGRYFDDESGVVYSDSSVVAFAFLGATCMILSLALLLFWAALARRSRSETADEP